MTIAIGVLATDGMVLAADSQETIPGYLKRKQNKILPGVVMRPNHIPGETFGGAAVTGAGSAGYFDYAAPILLNCALDNQAESLEEIEKNIAEKLKEIYRDHILPFSSYPDHDRPDFALLIGAQNDYGKLFWVTDRTTLRRVWNFEAVGSGAMLAKSLLNLLYRLHLSIAVAEFVAIYVISQVKQMIDGCGEETGVVLLKNNRAEYRDRETVKSIERACHTFVDLERDAFHHVIGHKDFVNRKEIEEEEVHLRLRSLKEEFKQLTSRTLMD